QNRTVQNYETSNLGDKRKVGDEVVETQVISATKERSALGTRYTHVLVVGQYYIWNAYYQGYFSPSYLGYSSQHTLTNGGISPNTYAGYTIDHFVEQSSANITFRLLPAH